MKNMVTPIGTCPHCGKEFQVVGGVDDDGKKLTCIPFEGPERPLLTGILILRSGPATYIGATGLRWSRREAIANVGISEVEYWERRRGYTPRKEDL